MTQPKDLQDLEMAFHQIEAEHLANQGNPVLKGITRTAQEALYGPIRDASMGMEYWGVGYRDVENILRRHLHDAVVEIYRLT